MVGSRTLFVVLFGFGLKFYSQVGAARAPVVGWSTWCTGNKCGKDWCTSKEVISVASDMKESGLQAVGFNHILLDDCWGIRNATTQRIQADPSRFPEGMPAFVEKIHDMGFKLGVYTDMGENGCHPPFTGSFPFYHKDTLDFAAWKVDYIKFDYCNPPSQYTPAELTANMSREVANSGRDMWFHFHCDGLTFEDARCGELGQSFRVLDDHIDAWYSTLRVSKRLMQREAWWGTDTDTQGYPDPDFVFTGGQGCGGDHTAGRRCPGQSEAEYRSEFGIWAIAGGQLVFASDPRNMSKIQRQLLLNDEIIHDVFLDTSGFDTIQAITKRIPASHLKSMTKTRYRGDQDNSCRVRLQQQLDHDVSCVLDKTFGCIYVEDVAAINMWSANGCRGVFTCNGVYDIACQSSADGSYFPKNATCSCAPEPAQIWTRAIGANKSAAVLLMNPRRKPMNIGFNFEQVKGRNWDANTSLEVRDLFGRKNLGIWNGSYTALVRAHDSAMIKLSPQAEQ